MILGLNDDFISVVILGLGNLLVLISECVFEKKKKLKSEV